ncbi:MAG: hypothetical protein GX594_08790 [Pirellulaceae bacterium]|nr:hypothetical protein [Pirellulaceae bacterium]
MTTTTTASKTLDGEFLGIRCRLIELAASMDRIERSDGPSGDPRIDKIRRGLEIIASDSPDRAERVQLVFSLPYDENWRK